MKSGLVQYRRKKIVSFLSLICFIVFIAMSAQAPKTKRAKKKGAAATASSGEEESGAERTHDEDAARRKSRRVTRANPDADIAEEGTEDEQAPVTPKPRPRPTKTKADLPSQDTRGN
jgi:cytoskeletal protein RodZ